MKKYLLTASAKANLAAIEFYYEQRASADVAMEILADLVHAVRLLAQNPKIGHRRPDLAIGRPLRFWPVRGYLITYQEPSNPLRVIGIYHSKQDIAKIVSTANLM